MKKILYIFLFTIIAGNSVYGQTFKAYLTAAEEAVQKKNYYAAYQYLQDAYEFDTTRLDLAFESAQMARMYDAYNYAEKFYQKVADRDEENAFPTALYYLGEMQQRQGNYDDAISNFDMYLSENETEGDYFTEKAKKEKSASEIAKVQLTQPDLSVTITRLGAVNTQFSEVGAIEREGKLWYSSLRFVEPNPENIRDPKYIAKILTSENGGAGEALNNINDTMRITSHTSFSVKSNKLFYTLCDYDESNAIKCDLYYRDVKENETYGPAVKLPDYINDSLYTSTQPSIGMDSETNKEVLYFVSDRPGGKGKYDIWYTIIDDNMNMTQPMNLDAINTKENDATPFYHNPSSTLYFSSQGYKGLGGYDVFRSEKISGEYGEAEHLQNPVNSSFDDLYYTVSNDMLSGHLSSNRESSTYIEDAIEACCFDIYHAKYKPVILDLDALTYEEIDGNYKALNGATVILVDARTGIALDSVTNMVGDNHHFDLDRNKEYLIIAKKEHYTSDTVSLSTKGVNESKTFKKKIRLIPKTIELDVFTFDRVTLLALSGATVMVENVTDGSIKMLKDFNPNGNDFVFTVREGHSYKITANRPNYDAESVMLNTLTVQVVDGRIKQDIFLTFGILSKPLALYFDNDRPNRGSISPKTSLDYGVTFDSYYQRKDLYINRSPEADNMALFFEDEVKGGYDTLQIFLGLVQDILESGEGLELTVKGFTSPLAASAYNLYLGQRRVASVMNELRKFNDGALATYLDNEKLIITDISFGETLAPNQVNDSRNNKKLSIYSLEASQERRVEIVGVNQIVK